jgi:hypothetical protein
VIFLAACGVSLPASIPDQQPTSTSEIMVATAKPVPTEIVLDYLMKPADIVPVPGGYVDDVESSGTGPEGRAPYGDSLDLNRFERPFSEDMTYIPDLDVHRFGLSWDADWYYISIQLIGNDPNNGLGISYGVELDRDADGYGDFIVWANPPYTPAWDTGGVQVFADTNKDSGGLNVVRSEAVFDGDGYETRVFNGETSVNDDPDLAWVRLGDGQNATIQFAFKKSWIGDSFMYGIVADAGLKDVFMFDYADRFTPADAGSPVRGKENFPLGLLYAVDNTCWDEHGFTSTGYEPKVCPPILQPVNKPAGDDQPSGCNPPPDCDGNGGGPYDPNTCICLPTP